MELMTIDRLREWAQAGYKYIMTVEQAGGDEHANFIVYPIKSLFTELRRLKIDNFHLQHLIVAYRIESMEAIEIATGTFGCSFYVENNN